MKPCKPPGETKLFGIFGDPVHHSLSPQMHRAAFEALNLPHVYLPFQVASDQLEKAIAAMRVLGIQGINLTLPHKEKIMPYLDEIDVQAQKIGAVNTVKNDGGRLLGFNTDGQGYVSSLIEAGVDPAGKAVLLIGAGGAAKGVAAALLVAGVAEMHVLARRSVAAENLALHLTQISPKSKITGSVYNPEKGLAIQTERPVLLINSTPLGMSPEDALPFPATQIKTQWVVSDLIYRPYETPLLVAAKKMGATTVPGLGMLLYQGMAAFEIWTGLKAPHAVMKKALWDAFSTKGSL